MTNPSTAQKFPEDWTTRDYDVFEKFSDGSAIWRGCVFGMANAESKLQELAKESNNRFFAIYLQRKSGLLLKSRAGQITQGETGRRKEARRHGDPAL